MKTLLFVPVRLRTTDVPYPGASTLLSALRSLQLGHQGKNKLSNLCVKTLANMDLKLSFLNCCNNNIFDIYFNPKATNN